MRGIDKTNHFKSNISLQKLLKFFKKTFLPTKNVFHSRAQFFNIKQEDNETLDEKESANLTIELDNYNRTFVDKKLKDSKQRKTSPGSSSDGEQVAYTKPVREKRLNDEDKKN